ncbi:MAG: amino acid adenylation domain-containing protein [Defluviitaleaceae bacterium]|nr:amino acid adenylation domain-containing protein [Defluviitaleaceae bacterium]
MEINDKLKKRMIHSILSDYKKSEISKSDLNECLSKIKDFFDHDDMAIIGISCEFPDAKDHVQFWENIITERESMKSLSDQRKEDHQSIVEINKDIHNKGGYLDDIDKFDSNYFKIPPKISEQMDPYHRKMLESVVNCIEDAGYYKEQLFNTRTGVFIGHDHTHRLINSYFDFLTKTDFSAVMGGLTGVLASRISHLFNFKGPSIVLDSACSSSSVAIDSAIKAIRNGDCETAFVGSINLFLGQNAYNVDGSMQSPDYCFRAFDNRANGTIWGEGLACIYIKPLSKAIADKDHIYGVIKAVAVNNDGKTNSLTEVNVSAQTEVALHAWEKAGISAEDISYIETPGIGTILGDPLEFKALADAFEKHTDKKQFCGIGTVKSNIGHTVGPSGLAALIKILMSFKQGVIPPTINFLEPNNFINFLNSSLYIQNNPFKWTDIAKEAIMGIHSFSFTGTNAHLVMKSYSPERVENDFQELMFPISAKNNELMIKTIERLQKFLKVGNYQAEDVSYTMSCGRSHQDFRAVIITDNLENLDEALTNLKMMLYRDKSNPLKLSESAYRIYCNGDEEATGSTLKALDSLAIKYIKKETVDFSPLFKEMAVFKCSLPPSEFDHKRFWSTPVKKRIDHSEPSTPEENEIKYSNNLDELLQNVWSEVLGYECIKPEDHFFELGGDSISGFKITGYLSEALQLEIPNMSILNHPIFADYLNYIRSLCELDDGSNFSEAIEEDNEVECSDEYLVVPLSSSQRGIYLTSQMMSDGIDDNIIAIVPNDKQHSFEKITDAVYQLTKRHDALRASFFLQDDIPVQVINHEVKIATELFHVQAEESSIELALKNKIEEISCAFDLHQPSLLRVYNIIINATHNFIVFDIHHIIADGISMGILVREFSTLIEGDLLPEKRYNYPQVMKKIYNKEEVTLEDHLNWWVDQFKEDLPVLNIATDRPRPSVQSYNGFRVRTKVNKSLLDSVKTFASKTECTLYMVLLGTLYQLICKLTNETDHIIGTLSANRNSPEEWNTVGMFVNTLPLRINLDQDETVLNSFSQLKKLISEYFSHHEVNYEVLVDKLGIPKNTSRNPLFDIYFALQNIEMGFDQGDELIETDIVSAKFDIAIVAQEAKDELVIDWECRSDLFDVETIERLASRYIVFLERMLQDVNQPVKALDCLLEEECSLILTEFNDTFTDYPKEKTVIELFEAQVAKAPENIAMTFNNQTMTYGELNAKANAIAQQLRNMGVKPGDYVALMVERSMEQVIGIYGIIKSGAAYVPIDNECPQERLTYMLGDCGAKAILKAHVDVAVDIPIINLADESVFEGNTQNLPIVNKPEDHFYLIYTSGTTGKPKGVICLHKGTVNLIHYLQRKYPIDQNHTVLQKTTYVFDASIVEIFRWSLTGAKGHLLAPEDEKDPFKMCEAIEAYKITEMQIVPSMLKMLLACVEHDFKKFSHSLKTLKYVFAGGEELKADHVKDFHQLISSSNPEVALINTYGPTETSIEATHYQCKQNEEKISIGKPIDNAKAYIMNKDALCGIGMIGELCIAGAGVTKGYLNNLALTKEKFIDNPFGEGRLYRTGDAARWLPDGNIEYLGRIDEQVKIRGFRIELKEIESAIRKIAHMTDAVAIIKEDKNKEASIYAYFIAKDELNIKAIQDELRDQIPAYMIPPYMMQIDQIPVTSNGKLDKKALPDIEAKSEAVYVAPRNETEGLLCEAFKEILSVNRVSIKDSFFELGGNSLRATRLTNKIETETGKRISLKEVMQYSTVEKLAELIMEKNKEKYVTIPVVEEKEYYPMSSVQKRMYVLNQFDTKTITYNMPRGLKLTGEVNLTYLEKALETMMSRHEILRTNFITVGDELVQKVNKMMPVDFKVIEDNHTSEQQLMNDFIQPFELGVGPLLRMKIVKRKEGYLLLMDMHHIISDGISMDIFTNELMALYHEENLEPLTHQYRDYSEWLSAQDLSEQKDYWLSQFEEDVPSLQMPLDYPRPSEQSFKGTMIFEMIEEELANQIKLFARQTQTTEYMVFLSAVMILLGKYSRQADIVIGSPISGRTHQDTENMLGMFANTLAMRGKPDGQKRYEEFLKEIKEICFKAYENQAYPFESLIENIITQRDMSRNPLFDVMLVMQNKEQLEIELDKVKVEPMEIDYTISKFDFTFHIHEAPEGYRLGLEYCTDLYKEESIKKLVEHLLQVLKQAIKNPASRLDEIEVITDEDKALILSDFNDTYSDYPREKTLVQLFEEQVEKTPHQIAVAFEEEQLTYNELNKRSNALAHRLRELGVKADDYVAIITEKSIEMIVGICGIVKAGGAYVPLDPNYPKERINYILEDCQPKVLLTYQEQLEIETKIPIISLDKEALILKVCDNLDLINQSTDLAYLIYTSGTTGKPKGVMVEHKNVISLVKNTNYIDFNDISIAQAGSLSFDAATFEVWGALLNGGKIVLLPEGTLLNATLLKEEIVKREINTMFVTTALYNQLMSLDPAVFDSLKQLLFGGEATSEEYVRKLVSRNTELTFANIYGPTENTTFSLYYPITNMTLKEKTPIGKGISNTQAYILDHMKLCGVGVSGELCLGGEGVARGYLNRPDLTKEKFIDNPYGEGKLYRTGDLARWLADGNIEYLGRIDDQVKIRGHRIELTEIESTIRKVEEVVDVVAIVREDNNGEKAIYAYFTATGDLGVKAIRDDLQKELPVYMMPSYMKQIDEIPITVNGKLDKKALPNIETRSKGVYIAPRNGPEEILYHLFKEILNVNVISVKDSFFELGGHSLRAMRLVNRIEAQVGRKISLKEVMKNPTIEKLAELVESKETEVYIPIPIAQKKPCYMMSSSQKRMYILNQLDRNSLTYNMPEGLKLIGEVNTANLVKALEILMSRHEILRTTFMTIDDEFVQRVNEMMPLDFSITEDNSTSEKQLMNDFIQPFDLSAGPLVRMKIIKRKEDYLLFIDMHHIISDGMSMDIFTNELMALYHEETLEELTHQYCDYSEWLRKRDLSEQKRYWLDQFKEEVPILDIPFDYPRPLEQSFKGMMVFESAGEVLTKQIKLFAHQREVTEYMVFLSALMILLGGDSGQEDVVVGNTVSGRTHQDTEKMLGVFVNTLAMRGRPVGEKEYEAFLEEIKEVCFKAYENQEYPFEELIEEVVAHRDRSRNPLFDVMLVMQNNEHTQIKFDQVVVEPMEIDHTVSKLDFTFHIYEVAGDYQIALEYCTDLYKEESAKRLINLLLSIIEQVIENPILRLDQIAFMTEEEKMLILSGFNHTRRKSA